MDTNSVDERVYTKDELFKTLERVFGAQHLIAPRHDKAESLYELARKAKKDVGVIVELGTYHGFGTICLYYGAKSGDGARVFTVDAFRNMEGWANEKYSPSDLTQYEDNIRVAGIAVPLFVYGFAELGNNCDTLTGWGGYPVSLLVWDGGTYQAQFDINPWLTWMPGGSTLALHDTENGALGCDYIVDALAATGAWTQPERMPGGFRIVGRIF